MDLSTFSCWNCHLKNTDFETGELLRDASKDPCCIIKNAQLYALYRPCNPSRKKSKLTRPIVKPHPTILCPLLNKCFVKVQHFKCSLANLLYFEFWLSNYKASLRAFKWDATCVDHIPFIANFMCNVSALKPPSSNRCNNCKYKTPTTPSAATYFVHGP